MFKEKKISSGISVGKRLKKTRFKKKYSLEYIESRTKIRAKYLQAIEADSFDKLPNLVYVKGFLKTYAKILGLNQNDILDQFEKENIINEVLPVELKKTKKTYLPKIIISPRFFIISLILLAILGFIVFLVFQISGFISPPTLEVYRPLKEGLVSTRNISFLGKTEPGISLFINEQEIAIDANGGFKEEVFLKDGTNLIELKAINKAGKETKKIYNFLANLPKTIANNNIIENKTEQQLSLKIKIISNSSWIKVVVDNEIKYQGIMLNNAEQEFTAKKQIILSVGNAGSVKIFLNNKDQGILGKVNEVKKNIIYKVE